MVRITATPCLCADVFDHSGEIVPGGEALNFACSACRYEHIDMALLGAIGDDIYGRQILTEIDRRPIDRSCVHIISGGATATHRIYLTEQGDRYFKPDSWNGGCFETFSLEDGDTAMLGQADIVHITHTAPIFADILRLKQEFGYRISADFNVEDNFEFLASVASYIDYFFISGAGREAELSNLLRSFSEKYDGIFIVTLAEDGSAAYHHGKEYRVSAQPVDRVIDTTGCGDSYQAGFIGEITRGGDIIAAMKEGSAVASYTLSHIGGLN